MPGLVSLLCCSQQARAAIPPTPAPAPGGPALRVGDELPRPPIGPAAVRPLMEQNRPGMTLRGEQQEQALVEGAAHVAASGRLLEQAVEPLALVVIEGSRAPRPRPPASANSAFAEPLAPASVSSTMCRRRSSGERRRSISCSASRSLSSPTMLVRSISSVVASACCVLPPRSRSTVSATRCRGAARAAPAPTRAQAHPPREVVEQRARAARRLVRDGQGGHVSSLSARNRVVL